MRIAMFSDTYYPYLSGVVISYTLLKKALEKQGHEVYIVTVNLESNKFEKNEEEKLIRLPGMNVNIPGGKLVYPFSVQVIKQIKKWKIDVIHSQTEFGVGTLARIVGKQLNIPIVHTYHTLYDDYIYYVTKGYFEEASKKLLEYFTKFYCDKTISELIVPTEKVKEEVMDRYGIEKEVNVIPNGIEIERFYDEFIKPNVLEGFKKEYGIKSSDFVIEFLGRVAHEKNISFLINAMTKLVSYSKNIKLVICGSGNALDDLKKEVKKKKLEENIIFTDRYPYDMAPYYYHLGSVFVMASITETQGMTVIEALASSRCVVCIDDKSYKDVVIDNYNGLIFKNEKDYIEKIKYLYENREVLKEMQLNARKSVIKFSSDYFASSVLEVYNKALNNKKKLPVSIPLFDNIKNVFKRGKDNE